MWFSDIRKRNKDKRKKDGREREGSRESEREGEEGRGLKLIH